MATVELKPISELFGLSFWVPTYQRGYRWTTVQVKELLEDLYEFAAQKKDDGDYYCLQPVIVKKKDDVWELVDGQQRLTAMWLVSALYYCSNRDDVVGLERKQYKLEYEEKAKFTGIFGRINDFVETEPMRKVADHFDKMKRESIDIKSLIESMVFISQFAFGGKTAKGVLAKIFEAIDDIKVIWYELDEHEDAIRTFTNVNANKIELTNAELIKAILLHANKNTNAMQNMALQWEEIEKGLNNSAFWNFIVNEKRKSYATRTDYLFEIWCVKNGYDLTKNPTDKHSVFRAINTFISSRDKEEQATILWNAIQEIYETLRDWFDNYYYYHTIGLLIIMSKKSGVDVIKDLYEVYANSDKQAFRVQIIERIKKYYFGVGKRFPFAELDKKSIKNALTDLGYSDSENVKAVLLLYNIAMLINANNTYERFPFELYKAETWDIEHINPQTPPQATETEQRAWLESYYPLIKAIKEDAADELAKTIAGFLSDSIGDFKTISQAVNELLGISDNDSITNLVLLDAATNRGYKNACFADKRKKIIEVERNKSNDEKYIPVGTKWVFLKGFENANQLIVWSPTDMQDYSADIADNIIKMLGGAVNGEN